jgi:uncharacterized protein
MIDTNVILSAILKVDSIPAKVLLYVSENQELVLCQTILDESYEVALRRFSTKMEVLNRLFSSLRFELLADSQKEIVRVKDIKDQPILNSAMAHQIDILITGDHHFLEVICTQPQIMTPTIFLQKYIESENNK